MVCMWVLDTHYSLIGNWLRDHTSWVLSGIGVKIKSLLKNFWFSVLNFTTPRYAFLFSNSETYIVHVINCEWSRSINFSAAYVLYAIQTCIFQQKKIQIRSESKPTTISTPQKLQEQNHGKPQQIRVLDHKYKSDLL